MDDASEEIVFSSPHRRDCVESQLVLDSAGIRWAASHRDGQWILVVEPADVPKAKSELEAYRLENPTRETPAADPIPIFEGAWMALATYSAILATVFVLSYGNAGGHDWFASGRTVASAIRAGQWWRTITALTLHADFGHLLSNLIFGGIFGFLAGRILGGGVAWFAIVIGGAFGNLLNAWVQSPTHSSLGASTAVFASLGIIVAHALKPRAVLSRNYFVRWSPLVGGVLLFAMTGIGGENTDVVAHATGFLSGLAVGWIGCRLPPHWLVRRVIQLACGCLTVGLVVAAWSVALRVAI